MSNEETASPAEGEVIKFPIEKLGLEDDIENKKYPFAPNRPFTLLTIDFDTDRRIPRKMLKNKEDFKNLIK